MVSVVHNSSLDRHSIKHLFTLLDGPSWCVVCILGVLLTMKLQKKFTQEIVHVIFLFTPCYTWIVGVAWFGLRAEVHVLFGEK